MNTGSELLRIAGAVAGIGGLALVVFLLIFRDVVRRNIFPQLSATQAYRIINRVLFLTFIVAMAGIGAWVYVTVSPVGSPSGMIEFAPITGFEFAFVDDFDDCSVTGLESRGWRVFNFDSVNWVNDCALGQLTLRTLRGDLWTKGNEPGLVHNMVLRRAPPGDFIITTVLTNFLPTKNWQQAGLIAYRHSDEYSRITVSYNDAGVVRGELKVQAVYEKPGGQVIEPPNHRIMDFASVPVRRMRLQLQRSGQSIILRCGEEDNYLREIDRRTFPLTPEYVGVIALQGITERKPTGELIDLNWEPAKANFEHFSIQVPRAVVAGYD
jgi:hypothetical protein